MIHFTLEEKLAIVAACLIIVALLATAMACRLSPACMLYKLCRSKTDDEEEDQIAVKIPANHIRLKECYKLIDYKTLLPVVPSIKVTTLDESLKSEDQEALSQTLNYCISPPGNRPSLPESPDGPPARIGGFLLTRKVRRSTSSVSGSSTASSERISSPRPGLFSRRQTSGSGTHSSDCDDPLSFLPPSSLEIAFQYNEAQEKLVIILYRARRIPPSLYGGASDSYVQVVVGKDTGKYWRRTSEVPIDQFLRHKNGSAPRTKSLVERPRVAVGYTKLAEYQTRTIRKDAEPVYKERFVVDNVKAKEKRNVWIKFILHSVDRFSHHCVVGTKQLGLDRASSAEIDVDRDKFSIVLDHYKPDLGNITLSLCYMPTAARLVITVTKIAYLKPPDGMMMANPYLKGAIFRRGKMLEKHVTSPQARVLHPSFTDEPLVFDMPPSELEKIVLVITVIHDDALFHNDDSPISDGEIPPRRGSVGSCLDMQAAVGDKVPMHKWRSNSYVPSKRNNTPLGRLAFGSRIVVDGAAKRHWAEMIRNPRKHITQTHKLRL